jgi:hypothetical protein
MKLWIRTYDVRHREPFVDMRRQENCLLRTDTAILYIAGRMNAGFYYALTLLLLILLAVGWIING